MCVKILIMQSSDKNARATGTVKKLGYYQGRYNTSITFLFPTFFTPCITQCVMGLKRVVICSTPLDLLTAGIVDLAEFPDSRVRHAPGIL